jgi:hypothetical protein
VSDCGANVAAKGSSSLSFGSDDVSSEVYANQQALRAVREKLAVLRACCASVTSIVRAVVPGATRSLVNVAREESGSTAMVQSVPVAVTCQR